MAKETFSFEEAAAPAKVFSFEEALGEPAAANAPATEPEVVTSARPWQGAGAGRGGLNDPRRLDVERAPESFERPGFAEGFTKGLTESERPLGPGGVLLRAADALTGGFAQERFNKANQSVLDDKTDPALAGEFAKPAMPKPKTPVLQPRTDTISPTGGVVDALAGVPANTARSLGSTVLNFGALAAELGLTIQSPEQFRRAAADLDKTKARTGLGVSDQPLARTGTALDALIPSAKTLADYAPEGIKQLGMMAVMGSSAIIADAGARGVNQAREEGLGIVPSVLYGAGQAASEGVPEAFSAKFAIEAAKRIPLAQALRGDAKAVTTAFQQTAQSMGVELGSEQVSALGNWVVDKIAADPTATPDRLVADMKEAVKATIVQGPTMLAGAKLMQAATTGLAQRPEDQAARELARELERGNLPPGTVETLNPNLSQPAITPKTLAGLTEIGAAASVDEAIIAAARATTPQAQAVDNIGRLLGDSANVSQPGNIPPVDSGAAGTGAPEPGIRVEAGMGASGAAGPALDAGGVRDQPAGGAAPLATGSGAELTPDIAETTRQIQKLERAPESKPGQETRSEPASVWFGRRGDGYQTPEDAQSALPTRTRISPELDWRVEQMPTGRYRLAGYDTETRAPTFTVRMNPTGTATVLGNPKAIAAKLAEAGITKVLPNRDGVTVATSQAQAAAQFLGGGEAAARTDIAPAAIKPIAQGNQPEPPEGGFTKASFSQPRPAAGPAQVEGAGVTLFRGEPATGRKETVGGARFMSPDRKVAEMYAGKDGKISEESHSFKNLLDAPNWVAAKEKLGLGKQNTMADLVDAARDAGHDGVSFSTTNGREYIVIGKNEPAAPKTGDTITIDGKPAEVVGQTIGGVKVQVEGEDAPRVVPKKAAKADAGTDTAPAAIKPVAPPANPPTQAQAGTPEKNPQAKGFENLLSLKSTKLILDDGRGRKLYDVQVTPAFRNRHFVNGRMPMVSGFDLKHKADVTGVPSDNGWVLIDNREQLASRNVPKKEANPNTSAEPAQKPPESEQTGPYGRDLTPIAQGGKPFKTKAEADAFRKANTNNMRTVKSGKGFALRELTPKELAAREKAAKRLAQASTSPAGVPIPAHAFIAGKGGLAQSAMADSGFDRNMKVGNRWLFAGAGKPGLTLAEAAELLAEAGYIREESESAAADIIKRSMRSPQYTAEGWERIAEAERATRFEDHLAAQQDVATEEDPFPLPADYLPQDAELAGLNAKSVTDEERAEVAALVAQAEVMGLEGEIFLEDAARVTDNDKDYYERAKQALQNAIAQSSGSRGNEPAGGDDQAGRGQEAQPESGNDRSQSAGEQGPARSEGLTGKQEAAAPDTPSATVQSGTREQNTPEGKTTRLDGQDVAEEAPVFEDLASFNEWAKTKARDYGGMRPFTASRLYSAIYPQIKALSDAERAATGEARSAAMKDAGLAVGDAVEMTGMGAFLTAYRHTGTVVMRGTMPTVKIDGEITVSKNGRVSVVKSMPWDGRWKKIDSDTLTAPTQQEVLDQQQRREQADDLDQREQIQREASGFQLQAQAPEQRRDNTSDMFGGPTAEDVARARKPGKQQEDDGTAPLFSRGRIDDATRAENLKRWSNNAPYVSSAAADTYDFKTGQKVMVEAYHGTARPDRVGTVFQRKRATSGPMAFFTSAPELASSYAQGKQDTSITDDERIYAQWFKYKPAGQRSAVDIVRAWNFLDNETKARIAALAPRIKTDDATGEQIELGPEGTTNGIGNYEWELEQTQRTYDRRGNPLKALLEGWLNGGVLFNEEERFLRVLELAGFPVKDVTYDAPNASYPFVYKTYIAMQKPLVTGDVPQPVIDALKDAAKRDRSRAQIGGADMWDKNTRTLREWVANYTDPANDSASYVWTSIPDKVTEVLKSMGYDGIIDWSGKGGGDRHPVYIPFEETQVKSATGNKGTFDPMKKDIRFSRAQPFYSALSKSIEGMTPKALPGAIWKDGIKGLINKGAVKEDEVEWSGIREWLDLQTGKVSKEDVLAYLDGNGVQVQEVVLGAQSNAEADKAMEKWGIVVSRNPEDENQVAFLDRDNPDDLMTADELESAGYPIAAVRAAMEIESGGVAVGATGFPKYSQYTLPGGENYREVLLTLPDKTLAGDPRSLDTIAREMYGRRMNDLSPTDQAGVRAKTKDDASANYKSSHWDQPNVLAHIRLNDRVDADGAKTLFVEEIQSDFGQDTKKQRDAINRAVDDDFEGIIKRMKDAGVLEVNCD